MGRLQEHEGNQTNIFSRRCDVFSKSPAAGRKANAPCPILCNRFSRSILASLAEKNAENSKCLISDRCSLFFFFIFGVKGVTDIL